MTKILKNKFYTYLAGDNVLTNGGCHIISKEEGLKIAESLLEFYTNTTQEEINEYNEKIDEKNYIEQLTFNDDKEPKKLKEGYVYIIQSDTGFIKIGMTSNLKSRLKTLRSASPHELELLGYVKTNKYGFLEKLIHKHFAEYNKNGEWFDVKLEKVLEYIDKKGYDFVVTF